MLNLRPTGKSISKRYTLNDFWIKHKMRETRTLHVLVSIAVELDAVVGFRHVADDGKFWTPLAHPCPVKFCLNL